MQPISGPAARLAEQADQQRKAHEAGVRKGRHQRAEGGVLHRHAGAVRRRGASVSAMVNTTISSALPRQMRDQHRVDQLRERHARAEAEQHAGQREEQHEAVQPRNRRFGQHAALRRQVAEQDEREEREGDGQDRLHGRRVSQAARRGAARRLSARLNASARRAAASRSRATCSPKLQRDRRRTGANAGATGRCAVAARCRMRRSSAQRVLRGQVRATRAAAAAGAAELDASWPHRRAGPGRSRRVESKNAVAAAARSSGVVREGEWHRRCTSLWSASIRLREAARRLVPRASRGRSVAASRASPRHALAQCIRAAVTASTSPAGRRIEFMPQATPA